MHGKTEIFCTASQLMSQYHEVHNYPEIPCTSSQLASQHQNVHNCLEETQEGHYGNRCRLKYITSKSPSRDFQERAFGPLINLCEPANERAASGVILAAILRMVRAS